MMFQRCSSVSVFRKNWNSENPSAPFSAATLLSDVVAASGWPFWMNALRRVAPAESRLPRGVMASGVSTTCSWRTAEDATGLVPIHRAFMGSLSLVSTN